MSSTEGFGAVAVLLCPLEEDVSVVIPFLGVSVVGYWQESLGLSDPGMTGPFTPLTTSLGGVASRTGAPEC